METEKNPDKKSSQKWLINTVYSEFNSGKSVPNHTNETSINDDHRCLARQPGRLRPSSMPSSSSPQQDAKALHLRLNDESY